MDTKTINGIRNELTKEPDIQKLLIKTLIATIALLSDETNYKNPKHRTKRNLDNFVHYLVLAVQLLAQVFVEDIYTFSSPDVKVIRNINPAGKFGLTFPAKWIASHETKPGTYKYGFCISYASEDRTVAHQLAQALQNDYEGQVFFDEFKKFDLFGEDLIQKLFSIYSEESLFCIILLSHSYLVKNWTNHELHAAQSRALKERSPYIFPILLGDVSIPREFSTTGCIKLSDTSISEIAKTLNERATMYYEENWYTEDELLEIVNHKLITDVFLTHCRESIQKTTDAQLALVRAIITLIGVFQEDVKEPIKAIFEFIVW